MMLNFRQNSFPYQRQTKYKTGLGNTTPRYNSQVNVQRRKYYINSTRNSQDVPQWMSSTNKYFLKSNIKQKRNNSMYENPQGSFMQTKQKWVYQSIHKSKNIGGQFQSIRNKKPRNKWQMKGHTYDFQWPKRQVSVQLRQTKIENLSSSRSKISSFFKYDLPKYGIKQSPLHRQRQTQIKIGHSALIDSVYIK